MNGVTLEICIASVADALAAAEHGANRLELNCALALGGLTPSLGLLQEVRARVALPLLVLLRPRNGDFVYSPAELQVMARDLELALAHGAEGVVFGALDATGAVDAGACTSLLRRAAGRPCVFHRAFDQVADPAAALETLVDLGFQRVLTSGQCATAFQGAERIAQLREQAAGRIELLPGGGITPANVKQVVARTGCDQVHASLRCLHRAQGGNIPAVRLSATHLPPDDCHEETDAQAVLKLRSLLDEPPP